LKSLFKPVKELSLYIHIPFCRQKCLYCDFYSLTGHEDQYIKYLDKVLDDLKESQDILSFEKVDTLFIGGGTPSLIPPEALRNFLHQLKQILPNIPREVTIESNPESLSVDHLEVLSESLVNRLSLGIQTLNDRILESMNRPTRVAHMEALGEVLKGYQRDFQINYDFITGFPGQNREDIQRDLKFITQNKPDHVSLYSLMIEEGAPLYSLVANKSIQLLKAEWEEILFCEFQNTLEGMGYEPYEISNYSLQGKNCLHNLHYWHLNPYLGLGAGAVSTLPGTEGLPIRFSSPSFREFMRQPLIPDEYETISKEDFLLENLMMGLRLIQGIGVKQIVQRFGCDLESAFPQLFYKRGLRDSILREGEFYKVPKTKLRFLDSFLQEFFEYKPQGLKDLNWPT